MYTLPRASGGRASVPRLHRSRLDADRRSGDPRTSQGRVRSSRDASEIARAGRCIAVSRSDRRRQDRARADAKSAAQSVSIATAAVDCRARTPRHARGQIDRRRRGGQDGTHRGQTPASGGRRARDRGEPDDVALARPRRGRRLRRGDRNARSRRRARPRRRRRHVDRRLALRAQRSTACVRRWNGVPNARSSSSISPFRATRIPT